MCSPRTTSCGINRVHSANFLFIDLTFVSGIAILSFFNRCMQSVETDSLPLSQSAVDQ